MYIDPSPFKSIQVDTQIGPSVVYLVFVIVIIFCFLLLRRQRSSKYMMAKAMVKEWLNGDYWLIGLIYRFQMR